MRSLKLVLLMSLLTFIFLSCKLNDASKPDPEFVANDRELRWLKNNAIRIKTTEAGNGFDDLQALKKIIGNATIVGLGENTHGTSEVFKMKHRLIEFLATEMGFTVFAIEAGLPESYRINDYVLNGKGDPEALLKGLDMWVWNTREVLDMILWMREYNESGKGKIQFTGFDMSTIKGALENTRQFAENDDKSFLPLTDSISTILLSINSQMPIEKTKDLALKIKFFSESIKEQLAEKKNSILSYKGEAGYSLLVRNVEIMIQSSDTTNLSDIRSRDRYMAQNVEWIMDNNPGSKIILWAHSSHIRKWEGFMGAVLSEKYGKDYFNVGFLSYTGTFTASDHGVLKSSNKLETGKPGSFEYSFHKTGIPEFLIDFSQVSEGLPESKWLTYELMCGGAGSYIQPIQYYPVNISKQFNAMIFIDSTNATNCFNVMR